MPASRPSTTPGSQLGARRRELGLTQRHVADHVGVTAQAVSEWERGSAQPARRYALAVDEFLACDGALARAFGYVTTDAAGHAADVGAAIDELRTQVDDLTRRLRALERERAQPARSPRQRDR